MKECVSENEQGEADSLGLKCPYHGSQRLRRASSTAGRRRTAPPTALQGAVVGESKGRRCACCALAPWGVGFSDKQPHRFCYVAGGQEEQAYLDARDLFFDLIITSLAVPDRQRPLRDILSRLIRRAFLLQASQPALFIINERREGTRKTKTWQRFS